MVICLERDADLHMAQLMPLPLTVSCFSEIQIGFTFPVPAHLGSPGKRAVKRVFVRSFVASKWCRLLQITAVINVFYLLFYARNIKNVKNTIQTDIRKTKKMSRKGIGYLNTANRIGTLDI